MASVDELFQKRTGNLTNNIRICYQCTRRSSKELEQIYETKKEPPKPVSSSEENETNVLAYFYALPHASIPSAKDNLGILYSFIQRILQKPKMYNYKIITLHTLWG